MRSVAQSFLARHPVHAGLGAGGRWILWLVAGHPFGILILGLSVVAGLSWWLRVSLFAGTEAALALWGFAGLTTGAQSLHLWGHQCRFRRRWPGQFAKAYRCPRRPPVVVGIHYSVPGGLRPSFAAPRLSVLPRAFDHRTIGWRLLPFAEHEVAEMAAAVGRVGGSDCRVSAITLRSLPGGELALIVRFRSLGSLSGRRTSGLGSLVIDETGGSALDPWDDPARRPQVSVAGLGSDSSAGVDDSVSLGGGVDEATAVVHMAAGPLASDGAGDLVSHLPPSRGDRSPREDLPMKWSLSVVLPSSILVAIAVLASDTGGVGTLAVGATTVVSLLLIAAEGLASR